MAENSAEARLNAAFGTRTVHGWPTIARSKPRWWQVRVRREEARVNAALVQAGFPPIDEAARSRFWHEARLGQCIYEDAGGYDLRCWWAALGLPFVPHYKSERAYVAELLDQVQP